MATDPQFDPKRRVWRVQYWADGKWHREIVGRAPARWKQGDPTPKMPPEVHARVAQIGKQEKESKAAWARGVPDSVATFLRAHVDRYQKPSSRDSARVAIDRFLAWCDSRGIARRGQVTREVCSDYVDHIAATLAVNSVTTHRAFLAAAWGLAVKKGKIPENPWKGVDPHGQARTKPRAAWSPEQFNQLLAACDDPDHRWLRDILVFGVQSGLRIGSLIRIEWSDWLRPQSEAEGFGELQVRKEICKTNAYKVPVSRRLNALLCERFGRYDPRFMLTGRDGARIRSRHSATHHILAACERAKLPRPGSPNHHMRRTFGRWAIMGHLTGRPVPIYIVSQWMGHATIDMTLEYLGMDKYQSVGFMVPDLAGPTPSDQMRPEAISPP